MKRYGVNTYFDPNCIEEIRDGDYVLFEDIEQELSDLRAENERMKTENEELKRALVDLLDGYTDVDSLPLEMIGAFDSDEGRLHEIIALRDRVKKETKDE
jgi:hypothetical protein